MDRREPIAEDRLMVRIEEGASMNTEENQHRSKRVNTADENRQTAARFRTIIDTIPVIAWCARPDGSAEFWNRRWHEYTGICLEDATGCGCCAAIHPDDLGQLEKKWQSDHASRNAGQLEARLQRFDGEYRWFLFRYEALRDAAGHILNWSGTDTHIDHLKSPHQQLRQRGQAIRGIT